MTALPSIITEGLTKVYGDKAAVDNLDFRVAEGSIACLLGPNGSGKSTTVAILTTLRRPSRGRAMVCGHDVSKEAAKVRALAGVALQRTGLDDLMTGREVLQLQGMVQGLDAASCRRRVGGLVEMLDLGTHIDTRLGTWSGGLRRRMDIAAALVHSPRVLFLDEPTTGLDPASRRALWAEIRRLNKEDGVTVLLTTQYLDEADYLAGEVSILANGRLLVTATPEELKESLGERSLTLELAHPETTRQARDLLGKTRNVDQIGPNTLRLAVERDEPAKCVAELALADLAVTTMTVAEPSLEDVFLHLTDTETSGVT